MSGAQHPCARPTMADPAWADARRILAIRLDSMGDVLMTTPAMRALKRQAGRHLTLLTSSSGAALSGLLPSVDEIITYDPPWMKQTNPAFSSDADMRMIARLRDQDFDAAVIFTVYSQSSLPAALMAWYAGIRLRAAHC